MSKQSSLVSLIMNMTSGCKEKRCSRIQFSSTGMAQNWLKFMEVKRRIAAGRTFSCLMRKLENLLTTTNETSHLKRAVDV